MEGVVMSLEGLLRLHSSIRLDYKLLNSRVVLLINLAGGSLQLLLTHHHKS
jgi:hypothetical protein